MGPDMILSKISGQRIEGELFYPCRTRKGYVAMSSEENPPRRHVFISHHHADDSRVDQLTDMLSRAGNDVRNSSVRMKPANQRRFDEGRVSDEAIRRVLRMKISWSSTVVVLVGKETHTRPWVNWEIEQAHKQGKRIVGVYERGCGRPTSQSARKLWNESGGLEFGQHH